jgi:hypothetical protein
MTMRTVLVGLGMSVLLVGASAPESGAQEPPPSPPPAAASQLPEQAIAFQARLDAAAQQLESDPQGAIEALDHLAVESAELRKTRPLTAAERPIHTRLFTLRARAHVQAMNNEKAGESFRELLRVDPFFKGSLSPREQELLDGIRTKESGLLEVSSSVASCRVLLDGLEIGVTGDTPVRVSVVYGTYEVRLEKPGFRGAGTRVQVAVGQTTAVTDLAPEAQVPPVAFLTDRDGVEVSVDNVHAGETVRIADFRKQLSAEENAALDQVIAQARFDPATSAGFLLRDPPIDRSVILRFGGKCLIEESRTIAITADVLAKLDTSMALLWYGDQSALRMRPDVGTLRVTTVPADADVYVDGALVGRSPFERRVCTGEHKVRIRHRIGSYTTSTVIARGRTEVIDTTLKPGLAFLGGVETARGALRHSPELTSAIDSALATDVKSFRLAGLVDLPPEIQRWNDSATSDLIAAADRGDGDAMTSLLRVASDNYDAPLMVAARARGAADGPVEILVFWYDQAGVDRVTLPRASAELLADLVKRIDRPADPLQLVFQNTIGVQFADTAMPDAPLVAVSVEASSPAAAAGLKAGDLLTEVDGGVVTASQLASLVRQKNPGEVLNVKVGGTGGPTRSIAVPVQRRLRRAPVFDPGVFGNALAAKLQTASAIAASADREVLAFNLALLQMRFKQWRAALESLGKLGQVPQGFGVGPGAVLYFRARCLEETGDQAGALALYREAAKMDTEIFADDGATVAAVVKLRLAAITDDPRQMVR